MAGFQVAINGRFWVATEAIAADAAKRGCSNSALSIALGPIFQ